MPGSLLGALTVAEITHHYPIDTVGTIVSNALGGLYFRGTGPGYSVVYAARYKVTFPMSAPGPELIVLRLVTGFIVGLTSVGSGSLYIAVLAIFMPFPCPN